VNGARGPDAVQPAATASRTGPGLATTRFLVAHSVPELRLTRWLATSGTAPEVKLHSWIDYIIF
jgi:hypothetical protein